MVQTAPQERDLIKITVNIDTNRNYLPSMDIPLSPSGIIGGTSNSSSLPLLEIAFDSYKLFSISKALNEVKSHHGRFGLKTIKKLFKLHVTNLPFTLYNIQHWKTYFENLQMPESYLIRIVDDTTGNNIQLTENQWNGNRLISTISHSFDRGKTQTIDLKFDRNNAFQVDSMYFVHCLGVHNIEGVKQLQVSKFLK